MNVKDASTSEEFMVEIERSDETTKVRVVGVRVDNNEEEFDKAYKLALYLSRRAKELDLEVQEDLKTRLTKDRVRHLWRQEDGIWKLDSSITNATYRIALSLLRSHPECTTQAEVIRETGVPQKTVSNHLGGRKKSVREYFSTCDGGYRLSANGLQWMTDEVVPAVLSRHTANEIAASKTRVVTEKTKTVHEVDTRHLD